MINKYYLKKRKLNNKIKNVVQGHLRATVNKTGCRFDFHARKFTYIIFLFTHSGNETNVGLSYVTTEHAIPQNSAESGE